MSLAWLAEQNHGILEELLNGIPIHGPFKNQENLKSQENLNKIKMIISESKRKKSPWYSTLQEVTNVPQDFKLKEIMSKF